MKRIPWWQHITGIPMLALALMIPPVFSAAQDQSTEAPNSEQSADTRSADVEPLTATIRRDAVGDQKYMSMYIGITYDEKLPLFPEGATFQGDYKKVTEVSIARELKTLRFIPTKEGVATLSIHDGSGKKIYEYRLDVKRSNLTKVAREIKALLSDIEGISVKIINNRVVVDGQILLPRDMNRIHSVVKQYENGLASSIVTLSPLAQRKIAQLIEKDINNPEISVRAVNEKFILEGQANDDAEKQKAEIIAKTYVPDVIVEAGELDGVIKRIKRDAVINLITVKATAPKEPGKIIQLVVHYVELNKNYSKSFRFQWLPTIQDNTNVSFTSDSRAPGGVVTTISGIVNNLLPKLNWAKSHGHARVLESSSLIVLDGQKGDLRSTMNIPYQVATPTGTTTSFAEAGLSTSITPNILNARSDSIRLALDFSLSNFLGTSSAGPMISKNSMNTVIIVRSGQSAAVGGLISNNTTTGYNKLPEDAPKNPILSLYASKDFLRNQSQFVVFVTPIIKSSASAGSEKIKRKFRLRD